MSELPKTFDPAAIEARWYAHWEANGLFRPERPGAEPFTIVNPPPNVTGSLHVGHALDNTLQDILVRHARLKGRDARWVVGTDHAGIATQMVVERQLAAEGLEGKAMGRDAFLERVWRWKAESGGQITGQLRRLGCSMDWANERFTMDEGFTAAVTEVFVRMHRDGLIYRDKRLVNWDPGLKTAISDLEVETREVQGGFWHLEYPLEDGTGAIRVATTRPETLLADMAVAVHPDDARYAGVVGRRVRLPITGRLIPVVADTHADPELGSGAVKITPGHDFNDFEVGRRAGIEARDMLNMLDADARVVQTADGLVPAELIGLTREAARTCVLEMLEADNALKGREDRTIQAPYGDRSGVVIEPWLTDQWYVDAAKLAKPAADSVRDGRVRIVPKSWEKTFFNWMDNIQPWCVSRQLWWGHRIPAWFGPIKDQYGHDGYTPLQAKPGWPLQQSQRSLRAFVAATEYEALEEARNYYGDGVEVSVGSELEVELTKIVLFQDPDVLDTWFSSALWPFATLGWPDETDPTLGGRYPNDVLVSGFDILFFWDARMMMQGLHLMGEVPFRTLYLHGLVRAADGQKMSKSKGNTVDPLGLIDAYGADSLRFFMAATESQGRDIKMDEKRVEGYRNFATKLWNAARFAMANGIGGADAQEPPPATHAVNKWIEAATIRTVQEVDLALADHRFDAAAGAIYQFAWSRFCDWYLELAKPLLADEATAAETRAVAGWVLDQLLVLLHPFMPFVTEELWGALKPGRGELIVADWPAADARVMDPAAEAEVDWLIRLVSEVRAARAGLNVPPGARLAMHVRDAGAETLARLDRNAAALSRLARVERADGEASGGAAQLVVDEATFVLPLDGVIDLDAERARLAKGIAAAEKERDGLAARLNNPSFAERAKPEAVAKARADHADKSAEAERLAAALARLG